MVTGVTFTGISPQHGSHAAVIIVGDAFNARTVTWREYHYYDLCVIAYKLPHLRCGLWLSLVPNYQNGKSWRTSRLARHKLSFSAYALYTAPPLSCGLSFSRCVLPYIFTLSPTNKVESTSHCGRGNSEKKVFPIYKEKNWQKRTYKIMSNCI